MSNSRSLVYKMSEEDFIKIIKKSTSCLDAMRKIGLTCTGGNAYLKVKERIKLLQLDTSHWKKNTSPAHVAITLPHEKYFAKNTPHSGSNMRVRILKYNLIPYKCAMCGNTGKWYKHDLVLQIDHINGDHNDNRLENLRFLCPNCHSQTETFAGKNVKIK